MPENFCIKGLGLIFIGLVSVSTVTPMNPFINDFYRERCLGLASQEESCWFVYQLRDKNLLQSNGWLIICSFLRTKKLQLFYSWNLFDEEAGKSICFLCSTNTRDEYSLRATLVCGHYFCIECLEKKWADVDVSSAKCPVCNVKIIEAAKK